MASFDIAQEIVKANEGGYQNNAKDSGNYTGGKVGVGAQIGTNHGVSAPVLMAWLGRTPTVEDMRNLGYATALQIFKRNYWDYLALDNLANQSIANMIYDGAINQGVGASKKMMADALIAVGKTGQSTESASALVAKINSVNQEAYFNAYREARKKRYDRNQGHYAYSHWIQRLNEIGFFFKENLAITVLTTTALLLAAAAIYYWRKPLIKTIDQ